MIYIKVDDLKLQLEDSEMKFFLEEIMEKINNCYWKRCFEMIENEFEVDGIEWLKLKKKFFISEGKNKTRGFLKEEFIDELLKKEKAIFGVSIILLETEYGYISSDNEIGRVKKGKICFDTYYLNEILDVIETKEKYKDIKNYIEVDYEPFCERLK